MPCTGLRAHQADFASYQEIIRVWVKRLVNEFLADIRPVGIGRVDERYTEGNGAPQHANCLIEVAGWTPDARAGDAHRAEAKPHNRPLAVDSKRAGVRGDPRRTSSPRCHVGSHLNSKFKSVIRHPADNRSRPTGSSTVPEQMTLPLPWEPWNSTGPHVESANLGLVQDDGELGRGWRSFAHQSAW